MGTPNQPYLANAHLAVVESIETGLFHGAVYRNQPTPSGSDRWLLSVTMNEGFLSLRKATIAVNAAFAFEQMRENMRQAGQD